MFERIPKKNQMSFNAEQLKKSDLVSLQTHVEDKLVHIVSLRCRIKYQLHGVIAVSGFASFPNTVIVARSANIF